MNGKNLKYFALGAAIVAAGLGAMAVTIPNTFSSGQVISAAGLNANFAALKAAVDPLETKVAALEAPAARPSAGSRVINWSDTSSITPVELGQFSVAVPGPGRLIVRVSGQAYIDMDSTTTSSLTDSFSIGLCDASAVNSNASCEGTFNAYFMVDPDNAGANNMTLTFVLERTVNITAAGNRTFFLNGNTDRVGAELKRWDRTRANALFIPAGNDLSITQP